MYGLALGLLRDGREKFFGGVCGVLFFGWIFFFFRLKWNQINLSAGE